MTSSAGEIEWFTSNPRALMPITGMRVSRSLAKRMRRGGYEVTFDRDFEGTMRGCMRPTDNWISEPLIALYVQAHKEGWAHSCEVWRDGKQVGGIYGLGIGGIFSAESKFHRETDMSKVALHAMIEQCRKLGFVLFDVQVMNPHLRRLGAYEISAQEFLAALATERSRATPWSKTYPSNPFVGMPPWLRSDEHDPE